MFTDGKFDYGNSAAQSGPLWNSGKSTSIQTTVWGPGEIRFFWKVSSYNYSPEYNNSLSFRIDGSEKSLISGEVDWQQQVYELGSGNHVLRWLYHQALPPEPDFLNAAWLDKVEYTPLLADSIAVVACGAQEKEIKALVAKITIPFAPVVATVIGAGIRTEPQKAALINGIAGTFTELDEGNRFARGHPAIHVIPAALAVAKNGLCIFPLTS
jgi:hypothetical protein